MSDIYDLQLVVDKISRLTAAMRASGLEVKVEAFVEINFEIRVDEPKKAELDPRRRAPTA